MYQRGSSPMRSCVRPAVEHRKPVFCLLGARMIHTHLAVEHRHQVRIVLDMAVELGQDLLDIGLDRRADGAQRS